MKKTIKIKFIGMYHDPHKQAYYHFLADRYNVVECDDPDYIIDGGFSFRHVGYDCIKILVDAENCVPDFDQYDYAVGSCDMSFGDRYVRVPWFAFYPYFGDIAGRKTIPERWMLERGFCSFVVSNSEFSDPMRKDFFHALSKYKQVASGGRYLNNIGAPVSDKLDFCRKYKFNIAFENSSFPGYTTEKIMEAYVAQTIPIYYGNPHIEADFRRESMIYVKDKGDIERAVSEIIRLDNDDAAYMQMVTAPCMVETGPEVYERRLEDFLAHIFDQPYEKARRLCRYGHQAVMRRHLGYIRRIDQKIRDSRLFNIATRLTGALNRHLTKDGGENAYNC